MGLFGKNSNGSDIEFEDNTDESTVTSFTKKPSPSSNRPGSEYGIQDAIKLMRKLPNMNTDIVISVVIKTLESADIRVEEIISDAQERESKIENRSVKLITEIDDLEAQIAKLNTEITQLNSDLEETSKVKTLLLQSIEADSPPSKKSKPAAHSGQQGQQSGSNAAEELTLAEGS